MNPLDAIVATFLNMQQVSSKKELLYKLEAFLMAQAIRVSVHVLYNAGKLAEKLMRKTGDVTE